LRSSADCTTFAFFARWLGVAAGTYALDIEGAEDVNGNALPPTAITVSFADRACAVARAAVGAQR
jgi:hypothetical protein